MTSLAAGEVPVTEDDKARMWPDGNAQYAPGAFCRVEAVTTNAPTASPVPWRVDRLGGWRAGRRARCSPRRFFGRRAAPRQSRDNRSQNNFACFYSMPTSFHRDMANTMIRRPVSHDPDDLMPEQFAERLDPAVSGSYAPWQGCSPSSRRSVISSRSRPPSRSVKGRPTFRSPPSTGLPFPVPPHWFAIHAVLLCLTKGHDRPRAAARHSCVHALRAWSGRRFQGGRDHGS